MFLFYLVLTAIIAFFVKLFINAHKINQTFLLKKIPYETPLYFVGNALDLVLQKKNLSDLISYLYKRGGNNRWVLFKCFVYTFNNIFRYYGVFLFNRPILMLRDAELVKQIGIKDFDHFVDHQSFTTEDIDPIWSRNLISMTG